MNIMFYVAMIVFLILNLHWKVWERERDREKDRLRNKITEHKVKTLLNDGLLKENVSSDFKPFLLTSEVVTNVWIILCVHKLAHNTELRLSWLKAHFMVFKN